MPEEVTISILTKTAMERSRRSIDILTTFFLEASVVVFVFGILDTYSSGKLTLRVGIVVGTLGVALLCAAFLVQGVFHRMTRRRVVRFLILQEESMRGGTR
jgi:hypothetical protein